MATSSRSADEAKALNINIDNLQESVESWITNLDSLDIFSLDRAHTSSAPLRNIDLLNLYTFDTTPSVSDLIVKRDPTSGEILDYYEDFKTTEPSAEQNAEIAFDENLIKPEDLLIEIPTIGYGIDFMNKDDSKSAAAILGDRGNYIDAGRTFLNDSFLNDSFTDVLNQTTTTLDDSMNSLSLSHVEHDESITEYLTLNEKEDNEIRELWKNSNPDSGKSSSSSSPSIDDLLSKRKIKKYAIEADPKLVKSFDEIKPKLAHQWPFELDIFQKQAVYLMENSENVFVAAHTSAGKTVVAEYAIALSFKHKTKVIYTSPIKALSNQKFREFKTTFDDVGLITGDIQIAPESTCLIMTTEILRSMLYKRSETLHDLEWVIFDEVHYMNDAHRGVVWEEVLILLPDHINIVMLSATIPNHMEFAEWVGKIKQRPIYVMSTRKRPVPLEHFLYTGNSTKTSNEFYLLIDSAGQFLDKNYRKAVDVKNERTKPSANKFGPKGARQNATPQQEKNIWLSLIDMLEKRQLLPVVIFTFSRKRCDENIDLLSNLNLNTELEKSKIHVFIRKSLSTLNKEDQNIPQIVHLTESLMRGIGVHHSGILPIMKEIIELLFQMSLIKVLFATETFAMGINMPARTVVFDSMRKHDGTKFRNLQASEYIQMAGRAGRRGLDATGTVIILCKNEIPDIRDLMETTTGRAQTLESKFRITYSMILSLLRKKNMRIQDFMRRSFSEHKMASSGDDPAVYEAANVYLNEKLKAFKQSMADSGVEACMNCNKNRISDYYHACAAFVDAHQELYSKLQLNGSVFRLLTPGRIVFVKSITKRKVFEDMKLTYRLVPVILVEGFSKDINCVLALALDEIKVPSAVDDDESWDSKAPAAAENKFLKEYEKINPAYEELIEKLKVFKTNDVQIPLKLSSLASFQKINNATLIQIKYEDVIAISTKTLQKTLDFSFGQVWTQLTRNQSCYYRNSRSEKFIKTLSEELDNKPSFKSAALELLRFSESYASANDGSLNEKQQNLLDSPLLIDFSKEQKELKFLNLFNSFKDSVDKLNAFKCIDCPSFSDHFEEIRVEYSIRDRIDYINDVISGNSLLMFSEYRYRIEVLKRLRLIDDKNFVLLKGKVALEISMSELLITELIIENVFSQMQPGEIVALLSAIVCQQKANKDDENCFKASFNNAVLDQGRDRMIQIAQNLNTVQAACQLQVGSEDDYLEQLNFSLVNVVYEWSKGVSFVKITSLTNTQEGIIVRTIQRLEELCNNLKNAAKIIGDTVLESKIDQCSVMIRRDIVFAGSLYTK